jgi:D-beta-D-heptose 7-phosphate kinase/D-beta-D-heptose 1-phosphate adenosyltransferase|tara:strand:- start:86604 stop:87338 length:735 start_codon:yes stop_codon:yes gene_type:complete
MKILVIGDSCDDIFVYGKCDRICPEAPVPVFTPKETKKNGGMARNVYNNIKSLVNENVEVFLVTNSNLMSKTRYVDYKTNQMLLRIDDNDKADSIGVDLFNLKDYDAVVISDYDKGFLTQEDIQFIIEAYPLTFIDTKKQIGDWIRGASFIKINETEYKKNSTYLDSLLNSQLIVTLGERGVKHDDITYTPDEVVDALDLSGAGDTFLAGLVTNYIDDLDIIKSILFAQECAGKAVTKKGVAVI